MPAAKKELRLTTVGVGAADSPRYQPAGLLIECVFGRVIVDGGGAAIPNGPIDDWLVTDERAELMPAIRRLAAARGLQARVGRWRADGVWIEPRPVAHTNHPAFGYLIRAGDRRVVWAPEFFRFPRWAGAADLMFAEAAGWDRPIRFAGSAGGHLDTLSVGRAAARARVRRLVFAHIGRPTIRAIDAGLRPLFGAFARDGQRFRIRFDAPS